jgi:hypothetical protein
MADQWRVAFMIWPFARSQPNPVEKVYDDEADAREHYAGLLSMEADHHVRRCDTHVYWPKLEHREVQRSEWVTVP